MTLRRARLIEKTVLSPDITDFRFELLDGPIARLDAGAHVDVRLPADHVRQYSLWDWDEEGRWFRLAVKQELNGRGGSVAMHKLSVGEEVQIGGPRNHFSLSKTSGHITLLAGGIGVTPIVAMARVLRDLGAEFRVFYLVRSREHAAMDQHFREMDLQGHYHLHCDDTDGQFDLISLMHGVPVGGDVYACGPGPLLDAVVKAGSGLRGGAIHIERFVTAAEFSSAPSRTFEIEVQSSGKVLTVGPDETILGVLRNNGIVVEFGCSEGLCGTCIVDVAEGEVEHRDGVLSPEEQATNSLMCVCVSRAKSARLVLRL